MGKLQVSSIHTKSLAQTHTQPVTDINEERSCISRKKNREKHPFSNHRTWFLDKHHKSQAKRSITVNENEKIEQKQSDLKKPLQVCSTGSVALLNEFSFNMCNHLPVMLSS